MSAYDALDSPLRDVPERRCGCCGKPFQPSLKRRRLCGPCFAFDGPRSTTGLADEHRRNYHRSARGAR